MHYEPINIPRALLGHMPSLWIERLTSRTGKPATGVQYELVVTTTPGTINLTYLPAEARLSSRYKIFGHPSDDWFFAKVAKPSESDAECTNLRAMQRRAL
jgi:hypothetical protein